MSSAGRLHALVIARLGGPRYAALGELFDRPMLQRPPGGEGWAEAAALFPAHHGARQIYDMDVDLVQTSCGYGVPKFGFQGNRDALAKWTEDRADILPDYWTEKNSLTIDGAPTGISGDKA